MPAPDFEFPSRADPHVAISNDELLVWGGNDTLSYNPLDDGARFDLQSQTWSAFPRKGQESRTHATSIWTASQWLFAGGQSGPTNNVWHAIYRPASRTWETHVGGHPLGVRRDMQGGYHAPTGRALLWGGYGTDGFLLSGAVYDVLSGAWTFVPEAPLTSRRDPHAFMNGDWFYVFGGYGSLCSASTECRDGAKLNMRTLRWESVPHAPTLFGERGSIPSVNCGLEGTQLFAFGGHEIHQNRLQYDGIIYDTETREVQPVPMAEGGGVRYVGDRALPFCLAGRFGVWGSYAFEEKSGKTAPALYDAGQRIWKKLEDGPMPALNSFRLLVHGLDLYVIAGVPYPEEPGGGPYVMQSYAYRFATPKLLP